MQLRTLALTLGAAAVMAAPAGAQRLTGAGATLPNPIYTKWFDAYNKATKVQINYQSIGSGGGIRQFTDGTVDFGSTDGPMSVAQMEAVQNNVLRLCPATESTAAAAAAAAPEIRNSLRLMVRRESTSTTGVGTIYVHDLLPVTILWLHRQPARLAGTRL